MYKVDIAIPNYNYGRYLRECVDSVFSQNVDGIRVLIIDNASTDNGLSVMEELTAKYNNIYLDIRPVNMGMHASFNKSIDWAQSDYFTILHADDVLADGALARAIDFLDNNLNVLMCYGDTVEVGSTKRLETDESRWFSQSGDDFILKRCQTGQNTVRCVGTVVRTQAQKQVGYYDSRVTLTTDVEMWLRFAGLGDVAYTTAIQGLFRLHENNDSAYTRERLGPELEELTKAFLIFFEKYEGKGNVQRWRKELMRAVSQRAYWAALAHWTRGRFRGAAELFDMSLSSRSYYLIFPPVGYIFKRRDSFMRIFASLRHLLVRMPRVL